MNIYDAAKVLSLSGEINPETVKQAFREACKKYHPDVNPAGDEMMKLVNAAFAVLKDFEGDVKEQQADYSELLNDALNAVLGLQGLVIEVCGAWVWITGNTRDHKDALKAAAFKWANKKKAWYFRPAKYKSRGRGKSSLDEIRAKYGSATPTGRTGRTGYRLAGA